MKREFVIVCLLSNVSYANVACKDQVIDVAHKTYVNVCDGHGSKNNCQIVSQTISNGLASYNVACSFADDTSGPDYSDYLNAEYLVDSKTCQVLNETINDCYQD
jgi:serine/threonine protein phosphatase PrpC